MQPLDTAAAHRHFSTACFNAAWNLLDKQDRSADEADGMVFLAHASAWHWTQRKDCTPRNLSISYWQLSRVYAVIGQGERAWHYGERCLAISRDEVPFYLGYAHEALARAAALLNDEEALTAHLKTAWEFAAAVTEPEEKKMLVLDLDTIGQQA